MDKILSKTFASISVASIFILTISTDNKEAILSCLVFILISIAFIFFSQNEIFTKPHHCFNNSRSIVLAFLICSAMGFNFYESWINSWRIGSISDAIGISSKYIIIFFSIIGTLSAIPIMSVFIEDFNKIIQNELKREVPLENNKMSNISAKKSLCILTGIFLVGISAILKANFNYIDDMGRIADGYRGWNNFSRFVSTSLSVMIHANDHLADISPLTQLIAVLILSLSGIILLYIVYERKAFSFSELLALIPIGLNPYFLECISYKFDAPYMSISILASIAPLLFRNTLAWKYILSVAIGIIIMCTSYQASSGIFPMIVILVALRMWYRNKSIKKILIFLINSIIGYGIGLMYFKQVIMIPTDTYVSNTLPIITELIPTIMANWERYFQLIVSDYTGLWKNIILLLSFFFLISSLKFSTQKRAFTLIVTVTVELFMLLLSFGFYPALIEPLFDPRAMYGFGIFLTLLCISTLENYQHTIIKIPALTLSWIFFVFAFIYGNALFVQKTYTDFRITQVISDLNDMEIFSNNEVVTVQISGSMGFSPIIERMQNDYPILKRLIPVTFRGDWDWGKKGFYSYYGLKNMKRDDSVDLSKYNLPLVKDSIYHTIYSDDNCVLINLK